MQFLEPVHHSRGLELEHADGVAASVELVCRFVGNVNRLNVNDFAGSLLYEVQALVYDGEGVEAEEVHLQHSHVLDIMAVILGCPDILAGFLVHGEADRDVVGEVSAADDGSAGVHSHLADAALELEGVVQDLFHLLCAVLEFVDEFRNETVAVGQGDFDIHFLLALLEPFPDLDGLSFIVRIRYFHFFLVGLEAWLQLVQLRVEWICLLLHLAEAVRHHFSEPGALLDAEAADSGHVLDGALRRHCTEGDDPGDVVGRIFLLHVFVRRREILEIHVDIRHADSVRVQETLEEELVLYRVQIGDFQAVSHNGTGCGTTSRPDHITFRTGCRNVVGHYEEVVRETHSADGLELEVYALDLLGRELGPVTPMRSLVCQMAEIGYRAAEFLASLVAVLVGAAAVDDILVFLQLGVDVCEEVGVNVELGQDVTSVNAVFLYLFIDFQCIGDDLRMIREEGRHLLLALEIFLLGVAESVRAVDVLVGSQADKPVVRRSVLLVHEMHVIGGDNLDPVLFGQVEDDLVVLLLPFIDLQRLAGNLGLVEHHLKVVVILKHPLVPLYGLVRPFHIASENHSRYFTRHTG